MDYELGTLFLGIVLVCTSVVVAPFGLYISVRLATTAVLKSIKQSRIMRNKTKES